MKPYEELTRLGRIRRMRNLAVSALRMYGITDARIQFVLQAGNTLFRIHTSRLPKAQGKDGVFEKDQYLLRIHEVGYQETQAIELELAWLYAMRHEADLPVPEPMKALNGQLLLSIDEPGIPKTRNVSLLRWIKGRSVENHVQPYHLRAQGRLLAQMHNFSTNWQAPAGLTKRRFDWDGLFKNDVGSGMTNAEALELLSPLKRKAFSFVAEQVREVMQDWGEGPDVFGLIHGDLGVDANMLFWHGEPRPIDFDDSGYGYWIFDLAVGMESFRDDPSYLIYKTALL
ncbi:MAG: phosphotransferase, partial [Anaerolineaceae bacterium]|nr:phosphotransferase [Anaerolineaceae bacterium]